MAEIINKLQPDRDLICYFQRPSAIAALSSTSDTGFTVSGTWRQQFDWAVIEWNRDNTFEHPILRNLPDGDLSGLTLTYQETRTNCIPLDSTLYPTVDWPYLRVWLDSPSGDVFRRVQLLNYATGVTGDFVAARTVFTLNGDVTPGDLIELAWDPFASNHYNYTIIAGDTAASAVSNLSTIINSFEDCPVSASASGTQITLTMKDASAGENANRVGVYGTVSGAMSESWQPQAQTFSGGASPTTWQVSLPFNALVDADTGETFSANPVRKMRWTYAADLQSGAFDRSEYQVVVSNWSVTGANREYSVAGPGSRRIEDDSTTIQYSGTWSPSSANRGNFSGGSITFTTAPKSSLQVTYTEPASHTLYLGTRKATTCDAAQVIVDGGTPQAINCYLKDDVLMRINLGTFAAGSHTVTVTYTGADGNYFYFDFLETAYPTNELPDFAGNQLLTLATDWDTDNSIALAPERTAWQIWKLGFTGRANHYQGALWFFEMTRAGQVYASATVTFGGASTISVQTTLNISSTPMTHLHLTGDTPQTVATAFALQINNGSTGVWATANSAVLTVYARAMGSQGNSIPISASVVQTTTSSFIATTSGAYLEGGIDGSSTGVGYQDSAVNIGWRTDLSATPRINRGARDWCTSFYQALQAYGIPATCSFSTELQYVDPSVAAGMAQRYYDGTPTAVNTPAIQTNFSPTSLAYWQEVYLEMAQLMLAAGQVPYLQFGEIQWWYFTESEGSLPFYDAYTTQQFQTTYGRPMQLINSNTSLPANFPQESSFLPGLIGQFTSQITAYVRLSIPQTKVEVLYPPDVNNFPMTSVVNLPKDYWTPANLNCLKTENFTYTGGRNLDLATQSIELPAQLGFPGNQSSHLVGISDYTTPWSTEVGLALGQGLESVVLFALDQFNLIGYPMDFYQSIQRGLKMA